jgi:hypothetical protein
VTITVCAAAVFGRVPDVKARAGLVTHLEMLRLLIEHDALSCPARDTGQDRAFLYSIQYPYGVLKRDRTGQQRDSRRESRQVSQRDIDI